MIEHIVRNGQKIDDIMNMYHVEFIELVNVNQHITDLTNLKSGMKIRIPLINDEVNQVLESTESFVMDYYPKIIEEIRIEKVEEKKEEIKFRKSYPGICPPKGKYHGIE